MQRQRLLVELRRLDGPDGLLNAQADEHFRRDVLPAHRAGLPSTSALSSSIGALPVQWRWKVSSTPGRSSFFRQSVWQALSLSMKPGVSGSTRIRRRIAPQGTSSPQKRQRWPVVKLGSRRRGIARCYQVCVQERSSADEKKKGGPDTP